MFLETALIEEQLDAFAGGELAAGVLRVNAGPPASEAGLGAAVVEFGEVGVPGGCSPVVVLGERVVKVTVATALAPSRASLLVPDQCLRPIANVFVSRAIIWENGVHCDFVRVEPLANLQAPRWAVHCGGPPVQIDRLQIIAPALIGIGQKLI